MITSNSTVRVGDDEVWQTEMISTTTDNTCVTYLHGFFNDWQ